MTRGADKLSCKISRDFIATHILSLNSFLLCDLKAVELPLAHYPYLTSIGAVPL
jgi:hypothetical protein